jgi:hypothetical protein
VRKKEKAYIWFAVLLACLLGGCSSAPLRTEQGAASFEPPAGIEDQASLVFLETAANQFSQRPGFPATFGESTKTAAHEHDNHHNENDDDPVSGADFALDHGYSNRPGETNPNGYIIAPGGNDDLAWAKYDVGSFHSKRPVKVRVAVTGVIAPGGNDDTQAAWRSL